MWHQPQWMLLLSRLLFWVAAMALLLALLNAAWARLPWFPLSEIRVMGALQQVQRADIEQALLGRVRGGFFSADLNALRVAVEGVAWVRHAEVRRRWPDRLEIFVEEHVPVAYWGESRTQWLNVQGEVFSALFFVPSLQMQSLPLLFGPSGSAIEVLQHYRTFTALLEPLGRRVKQLVLSPRLAWQLILDNGMVLALGRERQKISAAERLRRFVAFYPGLMAGRKSQALVVDARYPNGFALRFGAVAGVAANEVTGGGHEQRP